MRAEDIRPRAVATLALWTECSTGIYSASPPASGSRRASRSSGSPEELSSGRWQRRLSWLSLPRALLIALLAVVWAAVALAGGAAIAAASVRKLAAEALPAAALGAALVALVPLLGYVEAVAAPFLGRRLGRRAGSRYAGLRVLAKE